MILSEGTAFFLKMSRETSMSIARSVHRPEAEAVRNLSQMAGGADFHRLTSGDRPVVPRRPGTRRLRAAEA